MKRAFVAAANGVVKSELVPDNFKPTGFPVGALVEFVRSTPYLPYTTIRAGELGYVAAHDEETGEVEVRLLRHHNGLAEWLNHILFVPFDTDDILPGICCQIGNDPSKCALQDTTQGDGIYLRTH